MANRSPIGNALRCERDVAWTVCGDGSLSAQVEFLEEIVALVIDDDEGGEVLDLDAPDRLHTKLWIFHHFDLLDAVLGQIGRRSTNRGEIEAAMLLAGFAYL